MKNRKIKFRIWNSLTKKFTFKLPKEFHFTHKRFSVQQFTGLLDKQGKEIYEGDIVRILYTDWGSKHLSSDPRHKEMTIDEYMIDIAKIKVIHYDTNGFYASNKLNGYSETMECGKYGFIEVIGNIYENKDLIK